MYVIDVLELLNERVQYNIPYCIGQINSCCLCSALAFLLLTLLYHMQTVIWFDAMNDISTEEVYFSRSSKM